MQTILPVDTKWLNGMFLEPLKKAVADGDLIQGWEHVQAQRQQQEEVTVVSKPKNVAVPKKKATKKKAVRKKKAVSSLKFCRCFTFLQFESLVANREQYYVSEAGKLHSTAWRHTSLSTVDIN